MRIMGLDASLFDKLPGARARKKAANLSVDRDLLERARGLNLNLSQVFEAGLNEAIRRRLQEEWLRRNDVDRYRTLIARLGLRR